MPHNIKEHRKLDRPTQLLGRQQYLRQPSTAVHFAHSQRDQDSVPPPLVFPVLALSARHPSGGALIGGLPSFSLAAGCARLHEPCCLWWPHELHICAPRTGPLASSGAASTQSRPQPSPPSPPMSPSPPSPISASSDKSSAPAAPPPATLHGTGGGALAPSKICAARRRFPLPADSRAGSYGTVVPPAIIATLLYWRAQRQYFCGGKTPAGPRFNVALVPSTTPFSMLVRRLFHSCTHSSKLMLW